MFAPLLEGTIKSFVMLSKRLTAVKFLPSHETVKASLTKSTNVSRPPLLFNSERFTAVSCQFKSF